MNSPAARWCVVAAAAISLSGCAKKAEVVPTAKPASVELVQEAERSRHFDAVNSHLELGGTLYGYVDVDGDALALAQTVQLMTGQIAATQPQAAILAKQDYKALFTELGLTDIKAIGLSSVREKTGYYRNRAFIYTPDGRHGLFAVFGGQPGRFVGTRLAPKDTDYFGEYEFNLSAVYDTVKSVVAKVSGPEAVAAMEKQVAAAGVASHYSVLELIEGLNGRATVVMRLDPEKTMTIPGPNPIKIPALSAMVRVDGVGSALEGALRAKPELFEATQEGTLHLYTYRNKPVMEGLQLVLAVDGKALYAATSPAFLRECLQRTEGLDSDPAFTAALAAAGNEGNGLTWVSPRFFARLKALGAINPNAGPVAKRVFDAYSANIPAANLPLLSLRTNLPDGVLIRSTWNTSLKADLALFTIYNPVTIGLAAAMAIPAYQKVRANSQTMAVLNNLRQLSAAADQYYLETGFTTATYDNLVGPDKFVKGLNPVAGEDYHSVVFAKGRPLRVRMPDGQIISYPFNTRESAQRPGTTTNVSNTAYPDVEKRIAIVGNLRALEAAANRFYELKGVKTATFDDLVGPGKAIFEMKSVMGEDYRSIVLEQGLPLQIRLPDGRIVRDPNAGGKYPGSHSVSNTPVSADDGIMENLRQLNDAANQYYTDHDTTTTTFEQLVGPGKVIAAITPVHGEDYRPLLFKKGHPLRLYLKDGRVITYPP
jgi:type II secretory pathway pseudopilin PulG